MRSSDLATIVRIILAFIVVGLIIEKIFLWITIIIIALAFVSDGIDGFLAIKEESGGKIRFKDYLSSVLGNIEARKKLKLVKRRAAKHFPYGPRIDVAGDRVIEYAFWLVFIYTTLAKIGIISIFVVLFIVARHTFVDSLMGTRGTSSKMHTRFARLFYSSSWSRSLVNVLKFGSFAYLVLFYVGGYPVWIVYVLVSLMFSLIMLRGAAEIYEGIHYKK